MTWVLVVYLTAAETYLPLTAYPTEDACRKALDNWTFEPGWNGVCLPGIIEPEKRRPKRR